MTNPLSFLSKQATELTDYWPLGRVPQDRFNDVVQGNYKVVELSN